MTPAGIDAPASFRRVMGNDPLWVMSEPAASRESCDKLEAQCAGAGMPSPERVSAVLPLRTACWLFPISPGLRFRRFPFAEIRAGLPLWTEASP